MTANLYDVDKLIAQARKLASEYRQATGKSLPGVSNEIAEHDASKLVDLEICETPRPGGYDAIGKGSRQGKRVQIKGRVILDEKKSGHRVGQLKVDQEWDSIVLVLMDSQYESFEIYEAEREEVFNAIKDSKSSKRNKRGAMSLARFKIISRLIWTRENGLEEDEVWDNKANY